MVEEKQPISMESLKKDIDDLEWELDQAKSKIDDLESDLKELKESIPDDPKSDLDELFAMVSELQSRL
jgi:peptidoglycan hydrolase CwlO-like protein